MNSKMKIPIISDIHSNLEALTAVIENISKKSNENPEINIKNTVVNGDIVGYGANPNECIDLLNKYKITNIIKGNHDEAINILVMKKKGLLSKIDYIKKFNDYAQEAIAWTYRNLNQDSEEFLLKLPDVLVKESVLFVHGSPRDPLNEYIFENKIEFFYDEIFNKIEEKIIVMGHTHRPYIKNVNGKLFINPGSVGQPRDGNKDASYCILDTDKKQAEIIRVPYDIDSASEKIKKAGLNEVLATRLYEGK